MRCGQEYLGWARVAQGLGAAGAHLLVQVGRVQVDELRKGIWNYHELSMFEGHS